MLQAQSTENQGLRGRTIQVESNKNSITLKVPDGGTPASYSVNGKIFTVGAGQERVLPPNATSIDLPQGTIVEAMSTNKQGVITIASITINEPISWSAIDPRPVRKAIESYTVVRYEKIYPNKEVVVYQDGVYTRTDANGNVIELIEAPFPPQAVQNLITVSQIIRQVTTNNNIISGTTATDRN